MRCLIRKTLFISYLFLSGLMLIGCDDLIISIFSDVSSIEIDEESFKPVYNFDTFDIEQLKIIITRIDGSTQTTSVKTSMLTENDLSKLSLEGTHDITIKYRGVSTKITLVLIKQSFL